MIVKTAIAGLGLLALAGQAMAAPLYSGQDDAPALSAPPQIAWGNGGGNGGGWNNGHAGNNGWGNNGWGNGNNGNWNNGNWGNHPGNGNWGNGNWGNGGPSQVIAVPVNRLVANETIGLRQIANLGPAYRGRTVRSVIIETTPYATWGTLALLLDDKLADQAFARNTSRVVLDPGGNAEIGDDFNRMRLNVNGRVQITRISIELAPANGQGGGQGGGHPGWNPGWNPQPQPNCQVLERQVNVQVSGQRIRLNDLFNLAAFQGCNIEAVTLFGRTAHGFGQASLLVGGSTASNAARVGVNTAAYRLDLWSGLKVGSDTPELALNLAGNFTVQAVRLHLAR